MRSRLLIFLIGALTAAPAGAGTAVISSARHEPAAFDPAQGEAVRVGFALEGSARVALDVYDVRELRIRTVESQHPLESGFNRLIWDGRDEKGRLVPPDAYHYMLRILDGESEGTELDLSDVTGGEGLLATNVRWDPETGTVRYAVSKPARVNIRIGIGHAGPHLRTLIDWVPRATGEHAEPWNGLDESGVINLTSHPKLHFSVQAFSLSQNSIIVLPAAARTQVIEDVSWEEKHRTVVRPGDRRMGDFASQGFYERRDVAIALSLAEELPRSDDGVPIVSGRVAVRVLVDPGDRERLEAERFEIAFFVDGLYRFENEVAYLPMTWTWDASGANPGDHYITGNLRGFEGHYGTATLKVRVPPP